MRYWNGFYDFTPGLRNFDTNQINELQILLFLPMNEKIKYDS